MHDQNQHFLASIRNPCLQVICFSILNWVLSAISKDLHAYMALFKHCLHMIYKGNGTQLHLQQNCLYSYSYKHMRELTSRFNPSFFSCCPLTRIPEQLGAFCLLFCPKATQLTAQYQAEVCNTDVSKFPPRNQREIQSGFSWSAFFWHWFWVRWKMINRQQKTALSPVLGKQWPKLQTLACSCIHNELF